MLTTFLDNSFKFTFYGKIELAVRLSTESPSYVQFIIKDTGIGINPEK